MSRIEEYIDPKYKQKEKQYNLGAPDNCDLCGKAFSREKYMVDCQLDTGLWGNVCEQCFYKHGTGISWGEGQLYQKQKNGDWLMVAGFRD